jgi:flagellar biosynthetic protein FliQ
VDTAALLDTAREAIVLTLVLALPILLTGLGVALVVSVLQAATQVQEHTLSFVPKIVAMLAAAALAGAWIMGRLVEFAQEMFGTLP